MIQDPLQQIVARVVEPMGFDLVGIEHRPAGHGNGLLRVYIDREGGINLDHCAEVSRQLSAMLDVEDPITDAYVLEVSSPGLDRPLFSKSDFERFAGSTVNIRLRDKVDGRRRFRGVLRGVDVDLVLVDIDDDRWELPLELIEQARLVPEF